MTAAPSPGQIAAVATPLTGLCTLLVQQGYPALYALLITLTIGIGSTLIARALASGSGGPSGPGGPRQA